METDLSFKESNAEHEGSSSKETHILEEEVDKGTFLHTGGPLLQHLRQLERSKNSLLSAWDQLGNSL